MAYFNYRNLDSVEFEALAKGIMERLLGCSLKRYGLDHDGGIGFRDDKKHIVVQCKNYQQGSFNNLYSVLEREERPKIDKLVPRPERYYVFTPIELLPQQKLKILKLFKEYMEGESYIVDGITINDFFRDEQNHDLIPRNIKLFRYFPENYQYSPADLSQIEDNRLYDRLLSIFENDRKNHPSIRMMDPDPLLFPKGRPEILSDGRYAIIEEKEDARAIRDMISDSWKREDRRHILLVGEGGIGKTVAMLTLPEEDWFRKLRIPVIYVPLQRLDAFKGDLNRYIREKIGSDNYECCIKLANSNPEGHPRLLVLLDGFNEIPDEYKKDAGKYIREWMERPGIQIITTSRLGFFLENSFIKYRLQPLPYNTVRSYLLSAGIAEEQLPRENDRIWHVINVPLMLAMYKKIETVRGIADYSFTASVLEWKEPDNAARIIWDYLQRELYRCIEEDDSIYSPVRYAAAILAVAPYICCRMSCQNKFYIERAEFHELIRKALSFYNAYPDMLCSQILNVFRRYDPFHEEDLFQEGNIDGYVKILIDKLGLFQMQITIRPVHRGGPNIDYSCSLAHKNFRDALAAFFICLCLPKTCGTEEKKNLLNQADYYVKEYVAELFFDRELEAIWDRHRKEDPADGQITFILLDIIGRQKNYDYRNLDFSCIDLTKTNLHRILSKRLDICPLPKDGNRFKHTKIDVDCFSPNGHAGQVNSVSFSPDGRQLASCGSDSTIRIWNLESGDCRVLEGHTGGVLSVSFSPDGRQLASCADDSMVRIWDLESGESRVLGGHTDGVRSVSFSPDGRQLASGGSDSTVRIWNLESGASRVLEGYTSGVLSVSFSPDGRQLANGGSDSTVRIWNLESGVSRVLKGHIGGVRSVSFSPDGRQLASGGSDSTVHIWDLESGESQVLEGHVGWVNSVSFSPDGRMLASCAMDGTVQAWDLESGTSLVLQGHAYWVYSVSFSPDGRQIASGGSDRTVRVWDLESGMGRILDGHTTWVNSVSFSPDGRQLAGGGSDRTVRIWNLESGASLTLEGHAGGVSSVSFSLDGRRLASGGNDSTVRVWDLESGESRVLEGHAGGVNSVAFSPDGRQLASCAEDNTVRVWDLESDESYILEDHTGGVFSVAFSPDGRQLASCAEDNMVRVWDLESGVSRVLEDHAGGVFSVVFSPDGRQLAIGAEDNTVRVWDLISYEHRVLKGHAGRVFSVSFSPDGRQLASSSKDRTVRIWDLESGESRVLDVNAGLVYSVSLSPNGRQLASCGSDRTVRIWDLDEHREVGKYAIITHINLNGANFELAVIDEKDKEMLRAAGARV